MTIKHYETDDFIFEYEVQDNKVVVDFIDHEGKTVTLNHLWFYDPETVAAAVGPQRNSRDLHAWCVANWDELIKTRVDKTLLKRFFGVNDITTCPNTLRYLSSFSVPTTSFRAPQTPYFVLIQQGNVSKPVYVVNFYGREGFAATNYTPNSAMALSVNGIWDTKLNYSYKMNDTQHNFFRKTKKDGSYSPMYGLELEVNTKLTPLEIYKIVTEIEPKQEPFFIFKDDGSISGRFGRSGNQELVTVPCSYRYLRQAWAVFFSKLEKLCATKGYELSDVFDTSLDLNNGLHIHVSKEAFESKTHERKFQTLFNQWDKPTINFLHKISGRPHLYIENSYCRPNPDYVGKTLARRLKQHRSNDRYVVHDRAESTIEVRLFQGVFNLKHVLRCLEFTDAMVSFSQNLPYSGFGMHVSQRFFSYIAKTPGYKNLKEVI